MSVCLFVVCPLGVAFYLGGIESSAMVQLPQRTSKPPSEETAGATPPKPPHPQKYQKTYWGQREHKTEHGWAHQSSRGTTLDQKQAEQLPQGKELRTAGKQRQDMKKNRHTRKEWHTTQLETQKHILQLPVPREQIQPQGAAKRVPTLCQDLQKVQEIGPLQGVEPIWTQDKLKINENPNIEEIQFDTV